MPTATQRQTGNISTVSMLKFSRDGLTAAYNNIGGEVINCQSGQALNTGDIVYTGANSKVLKSTTASNYAGYVGVVVGGKLTGSDNIVYGTGIPVTNATDQLVYVQISGNALVVDGGTVTPGTHFSVVPDTVTAGRVIAGATAATIVGATVTAGVAAAEMIMRIEHR